jgi:ABC-type transport system involved in cytochrome bd biosynthesis fused ATPase/permease subunit
MVGRTVVVVAHRLSTIQRADQIVVMDNHKIVDVGTHDALLNRCGKYQDLIKRQSMMVQNNGETNRTLRNLLVGVTTPSDHDSIQDESE